jgi:hypothetical protein
METKTSTSSVSDGIEIFHNNFVVLDPTSNFLRATVGASDAMTGDGQCVGDENNLKGISIKMMVEFNECYSDVTNHLILLCSSKGDTPSLERFLDPGLRALTSIFFVGPTLTSFSFPDHLMSGQAQDAQVEAQTTQSQQEYYREDKHEHKTMDTKLLAPKSWAFWMTVVNHNSHRLTDHDKCVVESINHIIRHQNAVVVLSNNFSSTTKIPTKMRTPKLSWSHYSTLSVTTTLPNQPSTILDRSGRLLALSLSSTENLCAHTTATTKTWQQVPTSTTTISAKSILTVKHVSTSACPVNLFPSRQLRPRPTGMKVSLSGPPIPKSKCFNIK